MYLSLKNNFHPILLIFLLEFCLGFGQQVKSGDGMPSKSLFRIAENAAIEDFQQAFENANDLIKSTNENDRREGMEIVAYLALHLNKKINDGTFDVRNKKTIKLLRDFERHKFYIGRPKHNYITKVLIYLCEGRYSYVFFRFRNSRAFLPGTILISGIALIVLLSLLGFVKFRLLNMLSKTVVYCFSIFLVLFLIYKATCTACIDNYTFYGIPIM